MSEKYLDEILDPFFKAINSDYRHSFLPGQVFWTYYFYTQENLKFWRPANYDETGTAATEFVITSSTEDAFRRSTPLQSPKLETDEEFIVTRAKKRPVILIAPTPERIELGQKIRGGRKIHKNLCLVAPLYSAVDAYGDPKFPAEFIDRTRNMEFPHLFFVPETSPYLRHSICRLDSIRAVFHPHLEPKDLQLSDEAMNVFLGQIEFFLTGEYSGDYQIYRELLMSE